MAAKSKRETSGGNKVSRNSVKVSDVTVININPNVVGSGLMYSVYGITGSGPANKVASGSALNGPISVSVSGYDQYTVTFGSDIGCVFFSQAKIVNSAKVTLALTISQ